MPRGSPKHWGQAGVGDEGQRFEVRYRNGADAEQVFGWASRLGGAAAMVRSIDLHPAWNSPRVLDRWHSGAEVALERVRPARLDRRGS